MGLEQCRYIELPKVADQRGNLTFIEGERHIPFAIKRIFYIYDVPTAESRGAHANKTLEEVLVCLSGAFNVHLDDGRAKRAFALNRPWQALYIPPMIWGWEGDFLSGTVCLALASTLYSREDYYYNYDEYLDAVQNGK